MSSSSLPNRSTSDILATKNEENQKDPEKSQQASVNAPQTKLVITFFANFPHSTPSISPPSSLSTTLEPLFTKLLISLLSPSPPTLHTAKNLTPRIFQLSYLTPSPTLNPHTLRHNPSILTFERTHSLELVFDTPPDPNDTHRPIKLAIFDMDSTLIEEEVIDEMARSVGLTPAVSAITLRAMNGELDFEQSLRERLALLEGVQTDVWARLKKSLTIAPGARELCKELRRRGVVIAVASGGFAPMVEWLKEELGLDYAFANHVRLNNP